ncbi:MAG: paraquat-inducible protein A [Gammaproteobacteria bacterium]|nr:paraquat-inducible protein A [Gammaproteobacteria bacterium]
MSTLIACHGCDLLVDVANLPDGSRAACPRCSHFLTRYRHDAISRALAYAVTASVFLVIANSFSFLSMSAGGLESAMTLPETALTLYRFGMWDLAILVAGFIVFVPALLLGLVLVICVPLYLGHPAPWLISAARLLYSIQEWSMVEVFLIGVVVSLVKLAQLADVQLGFSFWAYVAFSITFTLALTTLDRFQCWQMIEQVQKAAQP